MIRKLPRWAWLGGSVLAAVAGMVNAIAYLSFTHQAATHVTGIFTHLSIGLFDPGSEATRSAAAMLISFFLGSVLCGYIIHDGRLKMGRRYGVALFLESGLLLASTAAFVMHSVWGERLAAMAAGLQNAMVSTFSGAVVRTTHMTGILTDLGALAGQKLRGIRTDGLQWRLLGMLMASFTAGGVLGVMIYGRWGHLSMLVPALTVAAAASVYMIVRRSYAVSAYSG